jgi:hypothetical protein
MYQHDSTRQQLLHLLAVIEAAYETLRHAEALERQAMDLLKEAGAHRHRVRVSSSSTLSAGIPRKHTDTASNAG